MNCSDAQPPHGVEREAIDVEHHRTPRRVRHRQVEERCAGLLGVDADRRRGGAQPIGFGRRRQHEELVRGDDEIVDRIVGFIGQIVDHEFGGSTGQHQSLHQMLGNLSHEDVAAPAHEHSAHRPPQYQWSLASTTISPRFSIITPVYDPPLGAFLACIDGVLSQSFGDWEWCLVDDCSTRPEVRAVLDDLAAQRPANPGRAPRHQRWNRRRVERCAVDGPWRVHRLAGSRRPAGADRARADGGDASTPPPTSTTSTATKLTCWPTGASRLTS